MLKENIRFLTGLDISRVVRTIYKQLEQVSVQTDHATTTTHYGINLRIFLFSVYSVSIETETEA